MSRRRRSTVVCTLTAVAIAVGGCGGGVDDDLTARADRRLVPLVEMIRTDIEAADPLAAAVRLSELRRLVARMRSRGSMTDEHAAVVLSAAVRVEDRLEVAPTTTTTTTTTTTMAPAPAPAPAPATQGEGQGEGGDDEDEEHDDDGNGKGHGKGKS
jgi:hypothetical protein